jgi:recombination protein RecA
LAVATQPVREDEPAVQPVTDERAISTGFGALDAILGLGGLPRVSATALVGEGTSGKTTLAFRAVAEAQAAGGIAAYLDLGRSLDPVEAVSRGVQLEWLVVLTPDTLEEALSMAAMLLQDRTVDLLLLDLPVQDRDGKGLPAAALAERIHRLAALARRAEVGLLILEPPNLPSALSGALTQISALQLELSRKAWIRLGRDVVGQRTEVRVARDRNAPPGRSAELRILYAEGGQRDACLSHGELLRETRAGEPRTRPGGRQPDGVAPPGGMRPGASSAARPSPLHPRRSFLFPADATPSSLLAPPAHSPGAHQGLLHSPRSGTDRARRPAVGERSGSGREPVGAGAGSQAGHGARRGP